MSLVGAMAAVSKIAAVVIDTAGSSTAAGGCCCMTRDRSTAAGRVGSVTAELAADDGCSLGTPLSLAGIGVSIISLIVVLGYREGKD